MFTNDWQQAADEKETMKKVTKLGSKWNKVHKERKRKRAGNLQTPLLPGSYLSMGDFASH